MGQEKASGPDFICFGGQKGGTRWLFDQLSHHPDFWMTSVKELHYVNERIRVWRAEPLYARALANIDRVNRQREESNMRPFDPTDMEWLEALIWLDRQPYNLDLYARLLIRRVRTSQGTSRRPIVLSLRIASRSFYIGSRKPRSYFSPAIRSIGSGRNIAWSQPKKTGKILQTPTLSSALSTTGTASDIRASPKL